MKKTCFNCRHFHGCLGEDETFYHIHNYCDAWDRTSSCPTYSLINDFLDDYTNEGMYDDHETGESGCYRFNPVDKQDEKFNDEWMKNNFKQNRALALKTLDKIIREKKCYLNGFEKPEKLDDDELAYYRDLREQIEDLVWEDDKNGDVHIK